MTDLQAPARGRGERPIRRRVLDLGDGGRAHVLEQGRGPPVLLLHGMGGLGAEILAPLGLLADRYRLIAVDRPGYGDSFGRPEDAMSPPAQAAWLLDVLDRLGVPRALLVAHSLASAHALWMADLAPRRIAGLVMVAPFCRPTRPAAMPMLRLASAPLIGAAIRRALPTLAPWIARRKLSRLFAGDAPASLRRLPFGKMAQPSAVAAMAAELNAFNQGAIPLALRLRRLEVRAVIVAGGRDEVAPWRRHALWAARRLPNSAGLVLGEVGHLPHHVCPAVVAAALESARDGGGRSEMGVI